MKDRIRKIRKFQGLNRSEFEKETGIKAQTWENIERGLQKINEEHINAIVKRYPQYAYWLTTGLIIPENGQISPEIEEISVEMNLTQKTGS